MLDSFLSCMDNRLLCTNARFPAAVFKWTMRASCVSLTGLAESIPMVPVGLQRRIYTSYHKNSDGHRALCLEAIQAVVKTR